MRGRLLSGLRVLRTRVADHLEDLEACDAPCGNARDRKLILLVQRMKKGEFGLCSG
jgi:hypothetical protein